MSDHPAGGNIQQRVFDRMPIYPATISIFALYDLLPWLARDSVQKAVRLLKERGCVEAIPTSLFTYRRTADATRPDDGRGWPKGKARK